MRRVYKRHAPGDDAVKVAVPQRIADLLRAVFLTSLPIVSCPRGWGYRDWRTTGRIASGRADHVPPTLQNALAPHRAVRPTAWIAAARFPTDAARASDLACARQRRRSERSAGLMFSAARIAVSRPPGS